MEALITTEERQIIMHTKQSLLFKDGIAWMKKDSDGMFDVTMGSYDGAETCEACRGLPFMSTPQ